MTPTLEQHEWPKFLKTYSDLNHGRPTRLGVFATDGGILNDYWVEDGLPLIAVDTYMDRGRIRIDFVFENFTHSVDGATKLICLDRGTDNGLDVSDSNGTTTQLRFEDWPDSKE